MTGEKVEQVEVLNVVVADTQALSVRNEEAAVLLATLRPIAERIQAYQSAAAGLIVANAEQAAAAEAMRERIIKDARDADKALRDFGYVKDVGGLIERLHKAHRGWTGLLSRLVDPLNEAARKFKAKTIAWQESERRKAEAERARLQAIEDERARKEQERLAKLAESRKTPEVKAKYEEAAAAVTPVVVQVQAPPAAVKARRVWKIAAVDLPTFCAAVAHDAGLAGYIEVRATALERAKAGNPLLTVPGVTFRQELV